MLKLLLLELTNTMILVVEIASSSCCNKENMRENNALSACQTLYCLFHTTGIQVYLDEQNFRWLKLQWCLHQNYNELLQSYKSSFL